MHINDKEFAFLTYFTMIKSINVTREQTERNTFLLLSSSPSPSSPYDYLYNIMGTK